MKVYALLMLVLAAMAITGCSDPTIDASSEAKMKESVAKVRESLPEAKRSDFDQAVQLIAFSQVDMKSLFANGGADAGDMEGKMRDALNGKTAEQVLAQAEQIQADRKPGRKSKHWPRFANLLPSGKRLSRPNSSWISSRWYAPASLCEKGNTLASSRLLS